VAYALHLRLDAGSIPYSSSQLVRMPLTVGEMLVHLFDPEPIGI
jgi:hypothetical protein